MRGQDHTQRCARHPPMISSKKSEGKHPQIPKSSEERNSPKIAPKMTRKSQRARRSSQRRMLPYIQRSDSIQESSLRNTEGKEAVQSNLPREETLESKRERDAIHLSTILVRSSSSGQSVTRGQSRNSSTLRGQLSKSITGSPKWQKLLRQDLGEMISNTR